MAESRFYLKLQVTKGSVTSEIHAPFVCDLPVLGRLDWRVVVLSVDKGSIDQGLHLWTGRKWTMCLDQTYVSDAIKEDDTIHIIHEASAPIPVDDKQMVFKNGVLLTDATEVPVDNSVYVVITPFTEGVENPVLTVNGVGPDENGNVELEAADIGAIPESEKGQPGGVAELGMDGKIPTSQLPAAVIGALSYQGVYDASANIPPLPVPSEANRGFYWVVNVAGTQQGYDLQIGDWIVSNGTSYDEIDNQSGGFAITGVRFVDVNGDPVNGTGSIGNPWSSISQAIQDSPAGTMIRIGVGSFNENVLVGSKDLWLVGTMTDADRSLTTITGYYEHNGDAQVCMDSVRINYTGTGADFRLQKVGVNGARFRNITLDSANTRQAIWANESGGAWTGKAVFTDLYLDEGKIQIDGGVVTLCMARGDSNAQLEVNGGVAYLMDVDHMNRIDHTGGHLKLQSVRSLGSSTGTPAITSSANVGSANSLSLYDVDTWFDLSGVRQQSYVNKTGTCQYSVYGLTRNLANDVWAGVMQPEKDVFDLDIVVSRAGVNYIGLEGGSLTSHLSGIDDALGTKLSSIESSGASGISLVESADGVLKTATGGSGISVTDGTGPNDGAVVITNTGVLTLSSTSGTGSVSLVNAPSGELSAIVGGGGTTVTEAGGIVTISSSNTGSVGSVNGLEGDITIAGSNPISVTLNGQTIGLSYTGLAALNNLVGSANILAGLGIEVNTVGQNITIVNTGVHSLSVGAVDLTEGIDLIAGSGVTLTPDENTNSITISATGVAVGVESINEAQGALTIVGTGTVDVTTDTGTGTITINGTGSASGVESVNSLDGALTLAGGTNVTLDVDSGSNTITINSSGGSGTITDVQGGTGINSSVVGGVATVSNTGLLSLNNINGAMNLLAGAGVILTPSTENKTITISSSIGNPVTALNTLKGSLNLVGADGITVTASGTDTLVVGYDSSGGTTVTSLNGIAGDISLLAGNGISVTTDGQDVTLDVTLQTVTSVSPTTDGTPGAVSLVGDDGTTDGNATIKQLIPSDGVTFVETATGVQIQVAGGAGTGSVSSVNGVDPDGSGNVQLTSIDIGAVASDGSIEMTGALPMGSQRIVNMADPIDPQDAVTLNYFSTLTIDNGTF